MAKKGIHIPKLNLEGRKFGKLTVVKYAGFTTGSTGTIHHNWLCKCDCGGEKTTSTQNLTSGHCKSCGCIPHTPKHLTRIKHHKTNTRLYNVWKSMKGRCYTKSCAGYSYYGGRGITVCDEWKNDYLLFYEWSIKNGYIENAPKGTCTLDRIDPNGNYCPGNCRWVTLYVQANNRTDSKRYMYEGEMLTIRQIAVKSGIPYKQIKSRIDRGLSVYEALYNKYTPADIYLDYNGEKHSIPEWSKITGIKEITIRARLKRGWSIKRALSEPTNEKGKELWKTRKRYTNT